MRNLMKRRDFIKVASAGVIAPSTVFIEPSLKHNKNNPIILSTWSFGLPANEAAKNILDKGGMQWMLLKKVHV